MHPRDPLAGLRDHYPSFPVAQALAMDGSDGFWAQLIASSTVTLDNGTTAIGWTWQRVRPLRGGGFDPQDDTLTGGPDSSPAFESRPPIIVSAAAPAWPGYGYDPGGIVTSEQPRQPDTITVAGGTFTTPCLLTVTAVDANGGITAVSVTNPGVYTVAPTSPAPMAATSGQGNAATFNLTTTPAGPANTARPGDVVWLRPGYGSANPDPTSLGAAPGHGVEYVFDPVGRSLAPFSTVNLVTEVCPIYGTGSNAGVVIGITVEKTPYTVPSDWVAGTPFCTTDPTDCCGGGGGPTLCGGLGTATPLGAGPHVLLVAVYNSNGITDDDFSLSLNGAVIVPAITETDLSCVESRCRGHLVRPSGVALVPPVDTSNCAGGSPPAWSSFTSDALAAVTSPATFRLTSIKDNHCGNYGCFLVYAVEAGALRLVLQAAYEMDPLGFQEFSV